jgi:hypothetical protein
MHRSVELSTGADSWSKIASTMPFPAEVKKTPNASEVREVREVKKSKKLLPYEYTALKNADALRLLRLGSANDGQLDIDCEIVEIDLTKEGDAPEAAPDRPKEEKKESGEETVEFGDPVESKLRRVLEKYEIKDVEEETPVSRRPSGVERKAMIPDEDTKGREASKKKTSYEAVSWCWGRESQDEVLRVNDVDNVFAFRISKNLKRALWALCTNNEVRRLWVDAICIFVY